MCICTCTCTLYIVYFNGTCILPQESHCLFNHISLNPVVHSLDLPSKCVRLFFIFIFSLVSSPRSMAKAPKLHRRLCVWKDFALANVGLGCGGSDMAKNLPSHLTQWQWCATGKRRRIALFPTEQKKKLKWKSKHQISLWLFVVVSVTCMPHCRCLSTVFIHFRFERKYIRCQFFRLSK